MKKISLSQKASDWVVNVLGSWKFVVVYTGSCLTWMLYNVLPVLPHFDPFPFSTLANLVQIQGALAASFVLIAQNRQTELMADNLKEELTISEHMKVEMDEVISEMKDIRSEMDTPQ